MVEIVCQQKCIMNKQGRCTAQMIQVGPTSICLGPTTEVKLKQLTIEELKAEIQHLKSLLKEEKRK